MSLKLTILGCGNSSGVPSVGNYWGNCDPKEPKNRRFKCSLAVQSEDTTIVIDTGADFRSQINMFNIPQLDGVFYTHEHSDHCHGIDDLRPFFFRNGRNPIPCYGRDNTLTDLEKRFTYLFEGGNHDYFYPVILQANKFTPDQYTKPQQYRDIEYIPFEMDHGTCTSVGYRFGDISYCVDMKRLDQTALDVIKGSKIWIVDGAAYDNPNNDVHANLESLYAYNEYIQAEQVYVSCLSSMMDYQTLLNDLPKGFLPAYDGLVLKSTG
tara:strand:- start:13562 stop:14359 length:798 start_codon:yes stop_codon:yes gene_type:complete